MLRQLYARLRALWNWRRKESELDEEIGFHLAEEASERIAAGLTADQARIAAKKDFGNAPLIKDEIRDAWVWPWVHDLVQDVRFGIRLIVKNPVFSLVAVLTLAVGIGATTAIVSVAQTVLLRPLPYPGSDRLVRVGEVGVTEGRNSNGFISNLAIAQWRAAKSFEYIAGYAPRSYTWVGPDGPEKLAGATVSPGLFPLLGVAPHIGRVFTVEEEAPGAHRVALLSYRSWVNRLDHVQDVVGAPVILDGEPFAIVGVLPQGFSFPGRDVEVWTPLTLPSTQNPGVLTAIAFPALARLRDGVTVEEARAEAKTIAQRELAEHPLRSAIERPARTARVVSLHEDMVREVRPALLVFLAAVVGVLVIGVTNLAGLLLARGTTRYRELAIRASLGAGRGRLIRQLLTESVVLSLTGGALGLLGVVWILDGLPAVVPGDVPRLHEVRVDAAVLGFTAGLSMIAGLIFGTVPALQWSRVHLVRTLNECGARSSGGFRVLRANTLRAGLVVLQVALALVLLVCAGLLLRSFVSLLRVDPGYDPANVLTAQVDNPGFRVGSTPTYLTPEMMDSQMQATTRFAGRLIDELKALPRVRAVTVALSLPFVEGSERAVIWRVGRPPPTDPGERQVATVHAVSPGYLDTMRLRLARGRFLSRHDGAASVDVVVVVSEALARAVFRGDDPVGQRIHFGHNTAQVVGVVRDVRYGELDSTDSGAALYMPLSQIAKRPTFTSSLKLAVLVDGDPLRLAPFLRDVVTKVDPSAPLVDVMTMEGRLSASVAQPRFFTWMAGLLATLAVSLAAIGLYGTLASTVSERRGELGVRMALGARRTDILVLVLRQGTALVVCGLVCGLLLAAGSSRVLEGWLFGVDSRDPTTYAAVPILLVIVALLAAYVPARRATRVEPMDVLRFE